MTAMLRPSKPRRSGISFRILALEPRMMFDGAAVGDVADKTAADSKAADTHAAAATATTDTGAKSAAAAEADKSVATATVVYWRGQVSTDTTGTRNEVVVVDTTVADWQTLVAGINPNTPVILLSPNADGMGELEVLAKIMSQYHDLDAIHLVAEGRTGAVLLGKEVIWSGDVAAASPYLSTIGAALKDGGDFMLYSCSVAGSDSGKTFIDSFARALGDVDVAASTDRTGPTRLGGDWDLEYRTGDIETVLPFTLAGMQDISHCLGCSAGGGTTGLGNPDTIYLNSVKAAHYYGGIWYADITLHDVSNGGAAVAAGGFFHSNDALASVQMGYIAECADNTAPTVTAGASSASYTENGTAVVVDNTITVADAQQTNLTGATAVISTNFVTGDVLNFTTQNGITGVWNAGTRTLALSGTATLAQYQAALRSITFSSSSEAPTNANRTVTWTVNDGQGSNNLSTGVTSTVHVTAVNDTPTGTPSVSGTTQVGQTLTGSAASVADLDGLGTFSYQWQSSSDGSTWNNISGATSTTYSLQSAENGKYVRLKVSYTDGGGTAEAVYSSATAAVTAPPSTTVSAASLSDDTGSSATDWVTKTASQTISGSLSAALVAGETVQVSFDNGSTWQDTSATVGATTFSYAHSLSGTDTFKARVTNTTGSSTAFSHAFTLDTTAPTTPGVAISADTGSSNSDGFTKTATQTVTVTAEGGATLDIDYGDGSSHGTASGSHTYTADGKYTISVTATDAAGNTSAAGTKVIVVDTAAPTDISPSVTSQSTSAATNGASFCTLSVTDPTNITGYSDSWTYAVTGGTDQGKFSISGGNQLTVNNAGGLSAGSYSVQVTATDKAGNSYAKLLSLTAVNNPTVTSINRAGNQVTKGTGGLDYTVTLNQPVDGVDASDFSVVKGAGVTGTAVVTVTAGVDGSSSYTVHVAGLGGDGTVELDLNASGTGIVSHSDGTTPILAGSTGGQTFTLDNTAPSAPTGLTISDDTGVSSTDGVTNDTTLTIVGTAEANSTVEVFKGGVSIGTTTADGSGAWSFDYTGVTLAEGTYAFTAKATDAAGNVSSAGTKDVVIDRTAPTDITPSITRIGVADATNGATFCALTATDATSISGYTDGWTYTLGGTDAGKFSISGGNLVVNNTGGLAAGSYSVDVTATDTAGNTYTKTLSLSVSTGPSTTVSTASLSADTGSSATDWITKTAAQTVSGSLSAALIAGERVEVSFDNGTTWHNTTATVGDTTFSYTDTLAGADTFKARVTDSIGSSTAFSHAYALDTTAAAPATPDLSAASDSGRSSTDDVTNVTTPTFTGTAEAGATVTLYDTDGTTVLGTATADGSGNWSITSSTLSAGDHTVTAKAVDVAGNVSTVSFGLPVTIDTTAPVAPSVPDLTAGSDSGVDDSDNITTTTTPTFAGTAEAGATVKLYDSDGTTVLGTGTADGLGHWSITTSALGVGNHTVTAKATDAAGNTGVASSGLAVQIVTGPAAPAGLAMSNDTGANPSDGVTSATSQTISGSAPAGATVLVFKDGVQVGTATADGSGAWTYATGTLADGTHVFTAKTRASGQDSAASGPLSITVDTLAPNVPVVTGLGNDDGSSTTDGVTTNRALVVNGTAEANSTVEVFKDGVSLGTATANGSGVWTYTTATLAYGNHVFTAKATDAAGNTSAVSSDFTAKVTTDSTAPGAPTLTTSGGGTSTAVLVSGTAEAGATVNIYDDGLLLATVTADGGGVWSYPATLQVRTHILTATATDAVGNVSAASGAVSVTITSPPASDPGETASTETKPVVVTPVVSAPLVTVVHDPVVADKPADMQTVVRTVPIVSTNGFGGAEGPGAVNGVGGGGLGGLAGGGLASGGDGRTTGGGGTFQVALTGRTPGGGDALVINTRVPDSTVAAGDRLSVTIPTDAFAHTRADAVVTLTATRADGAALPGWMTFNPRTGTFEGTPPPNFLGEVVVKVTARDNEGRQVVQTFKIVVGQDRGTVAPDRGQGQPGGRSGALPDQGGVRLGDARPAGRAGLTEQLRQMSFKGGMARHIAMFDAIKRGDKVA
ncbi:MAG: Ig-like domain-containing protein [Bacteroidota bacterium]